MMCNCVTHVELLHTCALLLYLYAWVYRGALDVYVIYDIYVAELLTKERV